MRAEAGIASVHDDGAQPPIWGLVVNRRMGASGFAFWELGLYAGGSEGVGMLMLNPGVQLRLRPRSVVTPVLAAHLGYLAEPEWGGIAPNATAGLLATAGQLSLMVSGTVGTHGGAPGPHSIRIGIGINSREQQATTMP